MNTYIKCLPQNILFTVHLKEERHRALSNEEVIVDTVEASGNR